jgi:hypothetical protein
MWHMLYAISVVLIAVVVVLPQTKQPNTYQDRFLGRSRLPIVHTTLLDELRLQRGLQRYYRPICAVMILRLQ